MANCCGQSSPINLLTFGCSGILLNISVIQKFFKCRETFEVYVGGFKKYWAVERRVPGLSPSVDKTWNAFWW